MKMILTETIKPGEEGDRVEGDERKAKTDKEDDDNVRRPDFVEARAMVRGVRNDDTSWSEEDAVVAIKVVRQ